MIRHSTISLEEGFAFLESDMQEHLKGKLKKNWRTLNGVSVKTTSQRYKVFMDSITCSTCAIEATYFALEKNVEVDKSYHLNLYGWRTVKNHGQIVRKEVLFTKDHILPRSKGGKDHYQNYQTMCVKCNNKKGNKMKVA